MGNCQAMRGANAGESFPEALPPAWAENLSEIKPMDENLWGAQMVPTLIHLLLFSAHCAVQDGGWYAYLNHGCFDRQEVFIKKFKESQTQAAEEENKIFARLKEERHPNVATPLSKFIIDCGLRLILTLDLVQSVQCTKTHTFSCKRCWAGGIL